MLLVFQLTKESSIILVQFQALGTAEMLANMVLGNAEKINAAPFAAHGRC